MNGLPNNNTFGKLLHYWYYSNINIDIPFIFEVISEYAFIFQGDLSARDIESKLTSIYFLELILL